MDDKTSMMILVGIVALVGVIGLFVNLGGSHSFSSDSGNTAGMAIKTSDASFVPKRGYSKFCYSNTAGNSRCVNMRDAKPGTYIVIEGEACKVNSMTKSKPGKHGAAKVRLEAVGLFDGKKRVLLKPADANIDSPIIEKKKAQAISISGNIVQLMDLETYETFETSIPDEFKSKLTSGSEGLEVLYWKFAGNIIIKEVRS